ncbi:MAG: alkaline phosphatase D family protein [Candidatus Rokuibacteriota bacterium]
MTESRRPSRRSFLRHGLTAGAALAGVGGWPRRAAPQGGRPTIPFGVQAGEVTASQVVLWSATDRPARLLVEYAATERFEKARRLAGSVARPETGYTAKALLAGMPAGQEIFYRVTFVDLADRGRTSAPVVGRVKSAPEDAGDVSFVWSGDTAGQGWGINPEWGGMRLYDVMRRTKPDFFVHSGDLVYADSPLKAEVELPGGGVWKNLVTPAKSKVAETLEEFRGNHRYNLTDEHVRRFNAEVPLYVQWDDHDVRDNWFPGQILDDDRYAEKSVATLAAHARQAMREFTPLMRLPREPDRMYRRIGRGPHLDLFLLDMRSHRGPNGENRETSLTDAARILGREQTAWLKRELLASRATWKVVAADMPIGLLVYHDYQRQWGSEAVAQGSGPPLGRELEIVEVLRFLKRYAVRNVVWITADVHYCATHLYEPGKAQFTEFEPFYEFVSGPIHAGGFGPNELDDTFGPRVLFAKHPPAGRVNTPPTEGGLYFGHVRIDGKTGVMTVSHRDLAGVVLHTLDLSPS